MAENPATGCNFEENKRFDFELYNYFSPTQLPLSLLTVKSCSWKAVVECWQSVVLVVCLSCKLWRMTLDVGTLAPCKKLTQLITQAQSSCLCLAECLLVLPVSSWDSSLLIFCTTVLAACCVILLFLQLHGTQGSVVRGTVSTDSSGPVFHNISTSLATDSSSLNTRVVLTTRMFYSSTTTLVTTPCYCTSYTIKSPDWFHTPLHWRFNFLEDFNINTNWTKLVGIFCKYCTNIEPIF